MTPADTMPFGRYVVAVLLGLLTLAAFFTLCAVLVGWAHRTLVRFRAFERDVVDLNAYRARREHPAGKGLWQVGGQR